MDPLMFCQATRQLPEFCQLLIWNEVCKDDQYKRLKP